MFRSMVIAVFIFVSSSLFAGNQLWLMKNIKSPTGEILGDQIREYVWTDSGYTPVWGTPTGAYLGMTIGDADNDGQPNLLILKSDTLNIYTSPSSPPTQIVLPLDTIYQYCQLLVTDITGDGVNEVLVHINQNINQSTVLVYRKVSRSYNLMRTDTLASAFRMAVGDLEQDGIPEIIAGQNNSIGLYHYNPTDGITNYYTIPSTGLNDMAILADIDNDNSMEVIAGGSYQEVLIWEYTERDGFTLSLAEEASGFTQGLAVEDVNDDGNNELIVGTAQGLSTQTGSLSVYSYADGDLQEKWSTLTSSMVDVGGISTGDIDADGINEIFARDPGLYDYNSQDQTFQRVLNVSNVTPEAVIDSFGTFTNWQPELQFLDREIRSTLGGYTLIMAIKNLGAPVYNTTWQLSSALPEVVFDDSLTTIPAWETDSVFTANVNAFRFHLRGGISPNSVPFTLFVANEQQDTLVQISFWAQMPNAQFTVLEDIGITFSGDAYTQASGVCATDFNHDGWTDVFVSPFNPLGADIRWIFWGDSTLHFSGAVIEEPMSQDVIIDNVALDYNNDFAMDVYELSASLYDNPPDVALQRNTLFKNVGNGFTDITTNSHTGITRKSNSAAVGDFDLNGFVDLYVSNGYGDASPDNVLLNQGDGTFWDNSELLESLPIENGQPPIIGDFNNDHRTDILVTNYDGPPYFFLNELHNDSLYLHNIAEEASLGVEPYQYYSADAGDLNNDGWVDIVLLGASAEIYLNQGNNTFTRTVLSREGGVTTSRDLLLFDYDQDGDLDLALSGYSYEDSEEMLLYQNLGNGTFRDVSDLMGFSGFRQLDYFAASDFNRDGSIDIFNTGLINHFKMIRNNGTINHWMGIELHGVQSNSFGIGARIELWSSNGYQMREVNTNLGNDHIVNFGLGSATAIDSVVVTWPGGYQQQFYDLEIDQYHTLVDDREPSEIENTMHPMQFALQQNYPNPFNPTTIITYSLPENSPVEIFVFDLLGREVWRYSRNMQSAGWHQIQWDGKNQSGQNVSTGVYFYRLQAGDFVDVKKMVFMK